MGTEEEGKGERKEEGKRERKEEKQPMQKQWERGFLPLPLSLFSADRGRQEKIEKKWESGWSTTF